MVSEDTGIEILQQCKSLALKFLKVLWQSSLTLCPLRPIFARDSRGRQLETRMPFARTKPVQLCTRLCRWPTAENCNTPCNTCNTWRLRWGGAFKVSGRVALLDSRWTETVNTHAAFNGRPRFYIYTYIYVSICTFVLVKHVN